MFFFVLDFTDIVHGKLISETSALSFLILFYFFLIQGISFAQANMRYVLKFLYLCVNADKTREGGLKAGKCFSSVSLKTYRRLLFLQRCMGRQVLPLKRQAVYND